VNVALTAPPLPSVTVTSLTETVGGASSSLIVPTPWPSAMVAFDGFDRVSVNVSFASSSVSPTTSTVTVFVVCPGVNVRVLDAAV
jgi:hypothetical protein